MRCLGLCDAAGFGMFDTNLPTKLDNDLRLTPRILLAASPLGSVKLLRVLHGIPNDQRVFQPTLTQTSRYDGGKF